MSDHEPRSGMASGLADEPKRPTAHRDASGDLPGLLLRGTVVDVQQDWIVLDLVDRTDIPIPEYRCDPQAISLRWFNLSRRKARRTPDSSVSVEPPGQGPPAHLTRTDNTAEMPQMLPEPGSTIVCEITPDGRSARLVGAAEVQAEWSWTLLEAAFWNNEALVGSIEHKVAGGFAVKVHGLSALLPGQALEDGDPPDGDRPLPAGPLWFRVRQFDRAAHHIVLAPAGTSEPATEAAGQDRAAQDWPAGQRLADTPALDALLAAAPGGARAVREREAIAQAGRWLRGLRGRRTLADLAAQVGTTPASLSMLERGLGRRGPTVGTISRLLHALDLQIAFRCENGGDDRLVTCLAMPLPPDGLAAQAAPAAGKAGLPTLSAFLHEAPGGDAALGERDAIRQVGELLRSLRGGANLQGVAESAGTTTATLSLVERGLGERGPTIGLVARILFALRRRLDFQG